MSLQVWLPLLGDLKNQGVGTIIKNSGTENFKNSGKIGSKSLNLHNSITLTCSQLSGLKNFTYCFWYMPESSSATENWDDVIAFIDSKNGSFRLETSYNNNYMLSMHNNTSYDIMPNANVSYGSSLLLNSNIDSRGKWYHVGVSVSEQKGINAYINGVLKMTIYHAGGTITGKFSLGQANTNEEGSLNDLRIYDEALEEKEIKRISRGLICHYKMDDDKLENTQNLITTEDCLSSTCYNAAVSKYSYGTGTDMYKVVTTYDGKKGTKVYMGTSGNNCYPYVYVSNLYTSDGTNSPAYKTLSFDYYGTIGNYLGPYPLGSGGGTVTYIVTCNGQEITGSYSGYNFFPVTPNKWNHIQLTFHGTAAADAQWGYIRIGNGNHVSNTSNFWFFANMQLEVKDHATGYAGVGGIRNSTKIFDNSGYNNDGIINGTLSITTDTPKYKYSTIFASGANYIDADRGAMVRDAITVSLWCKFTTWSNPISCTEGGGWNIENNSGYVSFPMYISGVGYKVARSTKTPANLTDGNWHMLTGTFDRENVKIYIDSVLEGTTATDSTNMIGYNGNNAILIGAEASGTHAPASTGFVGNISDVRIYATALSQEDIKSLYQNCITIDPDGTIRGQLRS